MEIPFIKSKVLPVRDDEIFKTLPPVETKVVSNFESTVKVEKVDKDDFDQVMKHWNDSLRRGLEIMKNDGIKWNSNGIGIEVTKDDVDIKNQIKTEFDKDGMVEEIRDE